MIILLFLLLILILFLLIIAYISYCIEEKYKQDDINIADLSKKWLAYNINKDETECHHSNTESINEDICMDEITHINVLEEIILSINIPNQKNRYPIFTYKGSIYVHTSGLTDVIHKLYKNLTQEEVKIKAQEIHTIFVSENISSPFEKYVYQEIDEKKVKTLYCKLYNEATSYKDREEIILMEKINE